MSVTTRASGLNLVTYKASPGALNPAGGGGAYYPPLWSSGEQVDAYGYHDNSYPQLAFDTIYRTQPYVAAVVNKLVRQIARTPIKVYREDGTGDHIRIRPESNDPGASLARLLRCPAPRKSAVNLKQWLAWPALVFGNALIAKYRGDGPDFPPTELIPMGWHCITPYAQPGGAVEVWQTMQTGAARYVPADQTVHFAWDIGGPVGVSPLEQLAISVRLEDAAQRLQTASYRNASRPSGGITMPPGVNPTPAQMKQMREDVESMHRGVDNAFKVAMLAPGAQWVPMMFSMAEAEIMASRQFNREEVCSVYDVKPGHVGINGGDAYSSVVEVNRDLYRTTLPPWFTLFEETIEAQLIDPEPMWEGLRVEFELRDMLRGDPEAVAAQVATQISSGQITPNEGRDIQNLPRMDVPGADDLYLQTVSNLTPLNTPSQTPPYPPGQTGETPPSGSTPPNTPVNP